MLLGHLSGIHFLNEQVLNAAQVNLRRCRIHRIVERQVAALHLVEQFSHVDGKIGVSGSFQVAVDFLAETYRVFCFQIAS